MKISPKKKAVFQKIVLDFYAANKRATLPWRKKITPYKIWISEVMLQQTQVERVKEFFAAWMRVFPTISDVANASQPEILRLWKGLGYNSRALRLKKAAEVIVKKYNGKFPKRYEDILNLPGIGPYTAGAISAFAYDQKVAMIETNIRRVYIHHFFTTPSSSKLSRYTNPVIGGDFNSIHDRDIMELIEQTLPESNFREWYWALMDYGSYLGKNSKNNPNRKSRHYTKQSKFEGSDRQIRSKILSLVMDKKKISIEIIVKRLAEFSLDTERIEKIIATMERDGFLEVKNGIVLLKN